MPVLNTVWGLGSPFEHHADLEKARILYSKASFGYKKVVGPDHPTSKNLRDNIRCLNTVKENGI